MSTEAIVFTCWLMIGVIFATVFVRKMVLANDDHFMIGFFWLLSVALWPFFLVAVLFTFACQLIGSVLMAPRR